MRWHLKTNLIIFNQYCSIGVSDKSLLDVEFNLEYRPSVIFYDADNKKKPMLANLEHLHKAAEHTYILVVDDANFDQWMHHVQV